MKRPEPVAGRQPLGRRYPRHGPSRIWVRAIVLDGQAASTQVTVARGIQKRDGSFAFGNLRTPRQLEDVAALRARRRCR